MAGIPNQMSRSEILTALTRLEENTRPVMEGPVFDFVPSLQRLYQYFNENPVMQAVFAFFPQNFGRAVQRINDHPANLQAIDRLTYLYGFFDQIARGTEDLIQHGVRSWKEPDYDRIVRRARVWLTPFLDAIVAHLRQVISNVSENESVPSIWLSLAPPDQTVKGRVEIILRDLPDARTDDKRLIFEYLLRYHGIRLDERIFDDDVPSFETIRRSRQILQREGKFDVSLRQQNLWDE